MKNNKAATVSRNYSLDLLRIVAMVMIIFFHACSGPIKYGLLGNTNQIFFSFFLHFGQIGVTLFMLITGYFSYKSNKKHKDKIIYILSNIWFYFLLDVALFIIFTGSYPIDTNSLLPITSYMFWYATSYAIILLLAPYFNRTIMNINQSEHKKLLIALFFVLTVGPTIFGFTNGSIENGWVYTRFFWFVYMYFLGAYLSKYQKESQFLKNDRRYFIGLTIFSMILIIIFMYIAKKFLIPINPKITMHLMWAPNSPLVFLSSVAIFMVFVKTNLTGKTKIVRFLQKISMYTLDIYLVHNLRSYYTIFASGMIFLEKYYESKKLILIIFTLTGFVFICSVIVSVIKRYTLDRIFYKILHRIDDKFKLNLFE